MSFYQEWPEGTNLDLWTEDLPQPWRIHETQETRNGNGILVEWSALAVRPDSDEVLIGTGRTEREALQSLHVHVYAACYREHRQAARDRHERNLKDPRFLRRLQARLLLDW